MIRYTVYDYMDVDKSIRMTPGLLLSLCIILIPSVAWTVGYDFSDLSQIEIVGTTLAKTAAFGGMSMFAWSLILSGRYKLLDAWFRGLDKVYIAHRFFGTASLALLLLHPLGLSINSISSQDSYNLLVQYFGFDTLAITLGRLSLYGLIVIAVWSIVAHAKHETFIRIHRWLGVLFILGSIHAFMAGSILSTNSFMWWYMLTLSLLAAGTFIHFSLLKDILHPYYSYTVQHVQRLPSSATQIELAPRFRIPNFAPGQFFYVAFDDIDPNQFHPYSVASAKNSSNMIFIIKQLGDYTKKLSSLKVGGVAKIKGPYGGFTFDDKKHRKQLWIAGGIGITPFLSKAHSLRFTDTNTHITMFHLCKTKQEAIGKHELELIEKNHLSFDYTCLPEKEYGIVSLTDIRQQVGILDDYAIYMCGPPIMMKAYQAQAQEMGIDSHLYFEEFSY